MRRERVGWSNPVDLSGRRRYLDEKLGQRDAKKTTPVEHRLHDCALPSPNTHRLLVGTSHSPVIIVTFSLGGA